MPSDGLIVVVKDGTGLSSPVIFFPPNADDLVPPQCQS